jgi:hypothetical protein
MFVMEIQTLLWLAYRRWMFRLHRTIQRLMSPRRLLATFATILFFIAYLANGGWMLANRPPANPADLQLWLSGGMAIYAIYHAIRCVYSSSVDDLDLTPSEQLWIGGAPTHSGAAIVCLLIDRIAASAVKTMLMMVALWVDSPCPPLLAWAVFSALVTIDILRLVIVRSLQMVSRRQHQAATLAFTLVGAAMTLFVLAHIAAITPTGASPIVYTLNAFSSLGSLAASDPIQWLAIPFQSSANLAVAPTLASIPALLCLIGSVSIVPFLVAIYGCIDRIAAKRLVENEREQLRKIESDTNRAGKIDELSQAFKSWKDDCSPWRALLDHHLVATRRYAGTILTSFLIPILLCLSPILSDELHARWLFVVGGIGFCTAMLAPAALKIDFRRDLRRMSLLRSMPVSASTLVTSQLATPIVITWVFQCIVLAIAGLILKPGLAAMVLWTGMLPALAVTVFAIENALFLIYPHHSHAQGVAMLIRAKLTFLGKGMALAAAVAGLLLWAILCRGQLPETISMTVMVTGAVLAAWLVATASLGSAVWAWRRFDLSADVPPA